MNIYLKSFLHRGLLFGGFGPIVVGIVYLVLEKSIENFSLSGTQVCLAIASSYLLAFVQAGASIFNQIEHWSLPKSLFCHFGSLYLTYVLCYILNSWIPFKYEVILIFTAIFVAVYFVIWTVVYFSVKTASRKMNTKLG
ncbi:MAG: DUF3021 domain-containing protein [Clostridia bacterium]|nr:DUF3021 domain-containing protein [Clostridia bacterium]